MKSIFIVSIYVGLCSLLGCTGHSDTMQVITGVVQLGRVDGATVTAFASTDTKQQNPLAKTKTDDKGKYHLSFSSSENNFLLTALGGKYTDESTQKPTELTSLLTSLVVSDETNKTQASITLLSDLIAGRTTTLSNDSTDLPDTLRKVTKDLATIMGLSPEDLKSEPSDPKQVADPNTPSGRHAFVLAQLSSRENNLNTQDPNDPRNALSNDFKQTGKMIDPNWIADMKAAATAACTGNFSTFGNLVASLVILANPANPPGPAATCGDAIPVPPDILFGAKLIPTNNVSCVGMGTPKCQAPCGGANSNPASSCTAWGALAKCLKSECEETCAFDCMPKFNGDSLSCRGPCGPIGSSSFPIGRYECPLVAPPLPPLPPLNTAFPNCTDVTPLCNAQCGPGLACKVVLVPCKTSTGTLGGASGAMCM